MKTEEVRQILVDAFMDVAPDADPTRISGDAKFRDALGIDSMDFLSILEVVARETGVEVPESDYGKIETFDAFVAYLAR